MPVAVDPRVELCFASKLPHSTCWIEIEAPVDNEPVALYEALRAGGWSESGIANLPPAAKFDPATGKPAGYQYREHIFTRSGSQIFGMWSPEEKRRFMFEARAIFWRFGFKRVPTWRKSLQDML